MISAISDPFAVCIDEIKYIEIINPNIGTIMKPGKSYLIEWKSRGIDYITIKYSTDRGNTWTSICGRVKNDGNFNWYVPTNECGEMEIKIEEVPG